MLCKELLNRISKEIMAKFSVHVWYPWSIFPQIILEAQLTLLRWLTLYFKSSSGDASFETHHTPIKIAKLKLGMAPNVGKIAEELDYSHIACENVMVKRIWQPLQQFLIKLNTQLAYNPRSTFLTTCLKKWSLYSPGPAPRCSPQLERQTGTSIMYHHSVTTGNSL